MPSFKLLTLAVALLSTEASAQYYLQDDYFNGNFFDKFSFFTGGDPTHGFVQYQDRGSSQNRGLISTSSNNAQMRVDTSNVTPNGRPSVRITSNKSYNSGLFIIDLQHMPRGCGTWPAYWTVGDNWPNNGEIDIVEGVHEQTVNAVTMHTKDGCTLANTGAFTGNRISSNCYVYAANQASNQGCTIQATSSNTYGAGLNNIGGGVYATEWVSDAITTWFFPRGSIPSDITNGRPTPSSWGKPLAQLYGPQGCDIPSHFAGQRIVFDTTFCGDWAGSVWGSSSCASRANSCNDFVANNPSAFNEAYWSINSLKVYHINGQAQAKAFTAATPANMTMSELQEPKGEVPDQDIPENFFVPVSPHGRQGSAEKARRSMEGAFGAF